MRRRLNRKSRKPISNGILEKPGIVHSTIRAIVVHRPAPERDSAFFLFNLLRFLRSGKLFMCILFALDLN